MVAKKESKFDQVKRAASEAAAKAKGEFGYGAQWAGQGAPLARALPAAELVAALDAELKSTPA